MAGTTCLCRISQHLDSKGSSFLCVFEAGSHLQTVQSFKSFSLADLDGVWQQEWLQSFHGDNPRGDGCAKALAQEWA